MVTTTSRGGILRAISRKPPHPLGAASMGRDPGRAVETLKVLIVEDESMIAWALESMIEDMGHEVLDAASTGLEAIAAAEMLPDLIVMDINLGAGMTGIEAAREIRSRRHANIIFVSAYNDAKTRADLAENVPGALLLSKPISAAALQGAIARVIGRPH